MVVLPGLGNNAADYARVADALRQQWGLHVEVAPVKRLDWCVRQEAEDQRNEKALLSSSIRGGRASINQLDVKSVIDRLACT